MDGQSIAVLAIVGVAAAILLRRVFSLQGRVSGCGMGCSGCSKNGPHQTAVPLVQLGTPPFSSSPDAKFTSATTPLSATKEFAVDRHNSEHAVNDSAQHQTCPSP